MSHKLCVWNRKAIFGRLVSYPCQWKVVISMKSLVQASQSYQWSTSLVSLISVSFESFWRVHIRHTYKDPACLNSCEQYVQGECNLETGSLTFTRECSLEGCQTEYTEVNACLDASWTTWSQWTAFFPSCVDEIDTDNPDTIFNDWKKHMPKRFRERECQFRNGTITSVNHVSGNCPFSDKIETERQTPDSYTKCVSRFEGIRIDEEIETETKVIVDFLVDIYEEWTPELEDPQSDAFMDLSEIYILGFLETLQNINEVNGTIAIQFATIRVIRFERMNIKAAMETVYSVTEKGMSPEKTRREKSENTNFVLPELVRAVFETVYDIIAPKDEERDTNIIEESERQINTDIAAQVIEQVRQTVEQKGILKVLEDHKLGEPNFSTNPHLTAINYEEKVLAGYYNFFQLDCDCATGVTKDYNECMTTIQDVSLNLMLLYYHHNVQAECADGPKKFLEQQGSCRCATWATWTEVGYCRCYDSFQQLCRQTFIRECEPAEHYKMGDGERWSADANLTCEGDKTSETKEQTCFLTNETTAIQTTTQTQPITSIKVTTMSITETTKVTAPSMTKIWVPIVAVIAFILFVLFIILIVCFFKRRKRSIKILREKELNKSKILKSSYDAPYEEEEAYADAYQNHIYHEYNPSPNDNQNSDIYEVYQDK